MQFLDVCESQQISGGLSWGDMADAIQVFGGLGTASGLVAGTVLGQTGVVLAGSAALGAAVGVGVSAVGIATYGATTWLNESTDRYLSDSLLTGYETAVGFGTSVYDFGASLGGWYYDSMNDGYSGWGTAIQEGQVDVVFEYYYSRR